MDEELLGYKLDLDMGLLECCIITNLLMGHNFRYVCSENPLTLYR